MRIKSKFIRRHTNRTGHTAGHPGNPVQKEARELAELMISRFPNLACAQLRSGE